MLGVEGFVFLIVNLEQNQKMLDSLESGEKFYDIFSSPPTKFSKTDHLANTITQVQQIQHGRWVLVKDNLMF